MTPGLPPIAVVSGSGMDLSPLLDTVEEEFSFAAMGIATHGAVAGHGHRFVRGRCGSQPLILQCGRLHLYEGYSMDDVVGPVEILRRWGVQTIVFTNAAGGLSPTLRPGDIVAVDAVRLWRYGGWSATPGILHPDIVLDQADYRGPLQWMYGPTYETRAEIRALQQMRSLAVGMSTAPELAHSQDMGLRAAVLSCITNSCSKGEKLTHEQVLDVAGRTSQRLCSLLRESLCSLRGAAP